MGSIPDWFWEAVDQKPQDHYVAHGDIDLHYLSWNEGGQRICSLSMVIMLTRIGGISLRLRFAMRFIRSRWI